MPWFKFVKVTRIQPTAYSENEKVRLLQFIHYVRIIILFFYVPDDPLVVKFL